MSFPFDIAVVFLPLLAAVIAGFLGRRIGDKASQIVTCGCVLVSAVISIYLFNDVALHGHAVNRVLCDWIQSGTLSVSWGIKIDTLTAVMLIVVNGVSSMVHVYSVGYMGHDKSIPRFMSYLSLFTFFMLMLVTSANLLQMFFGWEGVGLMSYLLINFWYEKPSANNASMKAFLVNRVGDFGFILGIFGCFSLFGSLDYTTIFAKASAFASTQWIFLGGSLPALTTICLLLFVGAMGKSAQLGLHTWLPDAMEGPTPVSALIHAATMVTAGVFMVVRLSPVFEYAPGALSFVAIVGALTCIFAAAIGLTQYDIKRVIAYSTMSQLGYMFFAAGVSAYSAAIFHLMTHAFFKALLFLCAGSVIHALSGEQDMRKMGGIWRKIPITYALMWIGSLALAGIGIDGAFGFAGFYSKDLILESAIARGGVGTFAYVLGLIAAFMTAFYSWRLIILTFHGQPRSEHHAHESPWIMLGPLVPLAIGAVFAGWYAFDWFGGEGREAFWNGAIFVLPAHDSVGAAHHVAAIYKWLPLIVAVSGIALAYVFYVAMPEMPAIVSTAFGWIYRLVYRKFYFDEIYDVLFVRSARRIGAFLWKTGDDTIIDGYGPNGFASVAVRIAERVSALESGYVYHYAFAMVIGVAAFVTWFWARG
jgi:NADH-quinone oxidoreductase subunit L